MSCSLSEVNQEDLINPPGEYQEAIEATKWDATQVKFIHTPDVVSKRSKSITIPPRHDGWKSKKDPIGVNESFTEKSTSNIGLFPNFFELGLWGNPPETMKSEHSSEDYGDKFMSVSTESDDDEEIVVENEEIDENDGIIEKELLVIDINTESERVLRNTFQSKLKKVKNGGNIKREKPHSDLLGNELRNIGDDINKYFTHKRSSSYPPTTANMLLVDMIRTLPMDNTPIQRMTDVIHFLLKKYLPW